MAQRERKKSVSKWLINEQRLALKGADDAAAAAAGRQTRLQTNAKVEKKKRERERESENFVANCASTMAIKHTAGKGRETSTKNGHKRAPAQSGREKRL